MKAVLFFFVVLFCCNYGQNNELFYRNPVTGEPICVYNMQQIHFGSSLNFVESNERVYTKIFAFRSGIKNTDNVRCNYLFFPSKPNDSWIGAQIEFVDKTLFFGFNCGKRIGNYELSYRFDFGKLRLINDCSFQVRFGIFF